MINLPHNDVAIFVRFLNNGPHLYDLLEAFREVDQEYLGRKLKMFKEHSDEYVHPDTPSYVSTLIRFWSYLDSKNKARLWAYIAQRDAERNGPPTEDDFHREVDPICPCKKCCTPKAPQPEKNTTMENQPLIKKVEKLKARIDAINVTFQPQQTTLF